MKKKTNIAAVIFVLIMMLNLSCSPIYKQVWDFNNFDEIEESSQNMDGKINYFLSGDTLEIYTRANTSDRVKLRSKEQKYLDGIYRWHIYVPKMGVGDMASIGCFLYNDDTHELDFELGYGDKETRQEMRAQEGEILAYLTSQGNPLHQEIKLIKEGQWHTCAIRLSMKRRNYYVEWFVDDTLLSTRQLDYGKEKPFAIYFSVENLHFMGDHIPKKRNFALFDYVSFEGRVKE